MMQKNKKIALCILAVLLLLGCVAGALLLLPQPPKAHEKGDYYAVGEHWTEALGEANPKSASLLAQKLLSLQSDYLTPQNRVFCAIIPDKGYYLHAEQTSPPTDYTALFEALAQGLQGSNIQTIDLTASLSLQDYYKTDSHWRQENLQPVLDALGGAMGFSVDLAEFDRQSGGDFIGAYGKGGASKNEPLYYLTSAATDAASADNFQYPEDTTVYATNRLATDIPYDVFLAGASPLITVQSPLSATQQELIVFRDSYASSLVPLLLSHYRKVTLVDIRYMASGLLPSYVAFDTQDVLFLYSTFVLNQSAMLR